MENFSINVPDDSSYPLEKMSSMVSIYHSADNLNHHGQGEVCRLHPELPSLGCTGLNSSADFSHTSECGLCNNHVHKGISCEDRNVLLIIPDDIDASSVTSIESAVFFEDKKRKIDFILVYSSDAHDREDDHTALRAIFEENLKEEGLELEYACEEEMGVMFTKIHAPWEVISRYGELLKFKMPMKETWLHIAESFGVHCVPDFDYSKYYEHNLFRKMRGLSVSVSDIHTDAGELQMKDSRFTAVYSREKEYLFDIPHQKEDFFVSWQRSRIVQFILKRKSFTKDRGDVFGFGRKSEMLNGVRGNFPPFLRTRTLEKSITKLIADGVYLSAYPLHEGNTLDESDHNPRFSLLKAWASLSCCLKVQPLDQIKHYFGVKVGLYFAWLGFYTYMLIPASIVGILCFIYGCITVNYNVPSNEICNSKELMCPRCHEDCQYWFLNEMCNASKVTYLVDNAGTVFFAMFMSVWGAVFLEMWKRYSADITHRWDLSGFDAFEEHPRPEYLARLANEREKKLNFVTRMFEPHVPFWRKRLPYAVMSTSIVFLLVTVALAAVVGVILYRISVSAALLLSKDKTLSTFASIITSTTAALLNLVCLLFFNLFYSWISNYLTEMELHRTQTEFDDSLTLKMFLLQFVNYYSSIFYIAFFKGKLVGHPGKYNLLMGCRQEECGIGGCLMELSIQLAIIMVGKQTLNNILEMAVPWVLFLYQWLKLKKRRWSSIKIKTKDHINKRWEDDYCLADWSSTHLFFEYLEMVLQFGFVTIFVAAFPLAPVFALINNVLEIRLDARKLIASYKRPVGVRVKDIGIWYRILDSIGKFAVLSNGVIIAFTSDMIPRMVYRLSVSEDYSLSGFVNSSLSYFNTSDFPSHVGPQPVSFPHNITICRYSDYRKPPWSANKYEHTEEYWHLLALRFAFVLIFENVILMITTLMRWLIPDVPRKLQERIRHENFIANEMMILQELHRAKDSVSNKKDNPLDKNEDKEFLTKEIGT